jgi:ribosomal protein S18 acetylase RimI-like enzyme
MRLFEKVLREFYWGDEQIEELSNEYREMGFYVGLASDRGDPFIDVSDNPEQDYYYKSPEHTGMFVRFRQERIDRSRTGREKFLKWLDSDEDEIIVAHVNSIVVAKKDRGTGIAERLLTKMIEVMRPDVVEISDESGGFWKRFASKHPEVEVWFED